MGVCNCSMFCCTVLYVHSSIAIILMGKRELIALFNLSSWCLVMVERLLLEVPQGCLQFVIVVFPDHTHLLFLRKITALATLKKWNQERHYVKVGDVVLVVSPHTSQGNWPLGRVLEVYPGTDGQVLVVNVQVEQGTILRSVTKLCPLECDQA